MSVKMLSSGSGLRVGSKDCRKKCCATPNIAARSLSIIFAWGGGGVVKKTRFPTNVRAPSRPNGQWGPAACLQAPQADTDASGFEHRARNVNLHVRVVVVGTRLSLPSLKSCSVECQVRPVVLLLGCLLFQSCLDCDAMRCDAGAPVLSSLCAVGRCRVVRL